MKESRTRSWTKSMTWRIMGIFILLGLGYLFTGSVAEASVITFVFHALRVVLYYVHERIWNKIEWGRGREGSKVWMWFWLAVLIGSFVLVGVLI